MNFKTISKIVVFIIIFAGASFLSYQAGIYVGEENILRTPPSQVINQNEGKPQTADFAIFWEVWNKVERNFLEKDKINYQKMVEGAVSGMLKTLDDPYTVFFNPEQSKSFNEELSGQYEGVGMVVDIRDSQLTIVSPIKGSPAYKAGLAAGDKILKIGDKETTDLSIEEAVKLIKGPEGTEVKLLVNREKWSQPKEFAIKREVIKIPTLEWELKDGDIALVKFYEFNQILTEEFDKAALEIQKSNAKKLIIDLRNNPGGYLEVAQNLAGWFVKKGEVVAIQDSGSQGEREEYKSGGPAWFEKYPIVVLINRGSASASEILAGALRDQNGTKLVGEKSFGKGSVQEQIDLSNGGSLKVTVSRWLTPKGYSINKTGLEPDIKVDMPEEGIDGSDPQLDKAIEILKGMN